MLAWVARGALSRWVLIMVDLSRTADCTLGSAF
eukprot:COSAG06_NODE_47456_length_339_cov_0.645833_1_plen_32_part_10